MKNAETLKQKNVAELGKLTLILCPHKFYKKLYKTCESGNSGIYLI